MSHNRRLLAHFANGQSITQNEATQRMSIGRLAARICELRAAGHLIHKQMIEVTTAHGDIARVARYTYLGGPSNANPV